MSLMAIRVGCQVDALRVRGKARFYDSDTLEESPALPLRPISDGLFTTGQGFVSPSRRPPKSALPARTRVDKPNFCRYRLTIASVTGGSACCSASSSLL